MKPRQPESDDASKAAARTIAFNSTAIYARTIAGVVLALFASRWTFLGLGPDDLGIYAVVGGLVGFLGILTGAMTQSAQRFLALGAGGDDPDQTARYFNASLTIHGVLAGLSLLLGVTFGAWITRHILAIPTGRTEAALLAYYCVLALAVLSIATVPVSAIFAARQRFGLMSVLEAAPMLVSAGIAFTLRYVTGDRLAYYVLMTSFVAVVFTGVQIYAALRFFPEARPRRAYLRDWKSIRSIIAFAGWNFFGVVASILSRQGSSVLINVFGGARATAAFGLAGQATNQAATLTVGIVKASYPEIVSREGRGERTNSVRLALRTTKYAALLTLMWMLPFFAEVDQVLLLWLTSVPEYTGTFVRLLMVIVLFDSLSVGYPIIVQSIGRIAAYQVSVGLLLMLTFPISYLVLRGGAAPVAVPFVLACVTFVQMLVRVAWVWRIARLSPAAWIRDVVGPAVAAFVAPMAFLVLMRQVECSPWVSLLLSTTGSVVLGTAGVLQLGLTREERGFVLATMRRSVRAVWPTRPAGR